MDHPYFHINGRIYRKHNRSALYTEVDHVDRAEHCWNGDQKSPNHIFRLHYNSMYNAKIRKRIARIVPKNANLTGCRYK